MLINSELGLYDGAEVECISETFYYSRDFYCSGTWYAYYSKSHTSVNSDVVSLRKEGYLYNPDDCHSVSTGHVRKRLKYSPSQLGDREDDI